MSKSFGGLRALDDLSLCVQRGERVALIGPNGAGKSTLFALIGGELRADAGEILLEGGSLASRLGPERRARLGLGRTFQSARLFAGLSADENIELALRTAGRRGDGGADSETGAGARADARGASRRRGGGGAGELELALRGALEEVGLLHCAGCPAGTLAQGERKRLELALVLAGRPRVLLLDEPTAGMGREEGKALMRVVTGAIARREATVVFSEHEMEAVWSFARRVIVLERGRVIADGSPATVRGEERVRRAYLGGAVGESGGAGGQVGGTGLGGDVNGPGLDGGRGRGV